MLRGRGNAVAYAIRFDQYTN